MQLEKVFQGSNVRIAIEDGKPLFHLGDVLKAVESKSNPSEIKKKLESTDLFTKEVSEPGSRGIKHATFINEFALIELLALLRVPKTKEFRRWVFREVIPTVMKTGKYEVKKPKSQLEQLAEAVLLSQQIIEEKDQQIKELEPKASVHDKVLDKGSSLGFRQIAATLRDDFPDLTESRLKEIMRDEGLIQKKSVDSTAKARTSGFALDVAVGTYGDKTRTQTRWTTAGLQYLILKIEDRAF